MLSNNGDERTSPLHKIGEKRNAPHSRTAYGENAGSVPSGKGPRTRCTHSFQIHRCKPGEWNAAIKDGEVAVTKGDASKPANMTLTADSQDYVKLFTGELDGMQAFMQGKIKLAGDLNLAMKLMQMFKIK